VAAKRVPTSLRCSRRKKMNKRRKNKSKTKDDSATTKQNPSSSSTTSAATQTQPSSPRLIQRITSGAGHDSVYVSKRSPTAMIFVPCKGGISHHPAEYCSEEDCENGAQVLLGALLRYDRLRNRGEGSWRLGRIGS